MSGNGRVNTFMPSWEKQREARYMWYSLVSRTNFPERPANIGFAKKRLARARRMVLNQNSPIRYAIGDEQRLHGLRRIGSADQQVMEVTAAPGMNGGERAQVCVFSNNSTRRIAWINNSVSPQDDEDAPVAIGPVG